jgi:hypothetical protein
VLSSSNRSCSCLCGEFGLRRKGEKPGGGSSSSGSGDDDRSAAFFPRGIVGSALAGERRVRKRVEQAERLAMAVCLHECCHSKVHDANWLGHNFQSILKYAERLAPRDPARPPELTRNFIDKSKSSPPFIPDAKRVTGQGEAAYPRIRVRQRIWLPIKQWLSPQLQTVSMGLQR